MAQGPMDPDVSFDVPEQRRELREHPVTVLGAIALGGVIGALARYGVGALLPHGTGAWAWSTFLINVSGCLLLGVLMAVIEHHVPDQKLLRPFAGVGILGGYTTFSTATVDVVQMLSAHQPLPALGYLCATAVGALVAVAIGFGVTDALVRR